jgi:hypothetical protein
VLPHTVKEFPRFSPEKPAAFNDADGDHNPSSARIAKPHSDRRPCPVCPPVLLSYAADRGEVPNNRGQARNQQEYDDKQ